LHVLLVRPNRQGHHLPSPGSSFRLPSPALFARSCDQMSRVQKPSGPDSPPMPIQVPDPPFIPTFPRRRRAGSGVRAADPPLSGLRGVESLRALIRPVKVEPARTSHANMVVGIVYHWTAQVSSTEAGVIFGSILWPMSEACVILNDNHSTSISSSQCTVTRRIYRAFAFFQLYAASISPRSFPLRAHRRCEQFRGRRGCSESLAQEQRASPQTSAQTKNRPKPTK